MAKNEIVAESWRDQTGKNRNGSSMFYDGDTIYSYGRHFPMAKLWKVGADVTVVLVTTQGYSGSTSAHLSIVRGAVKKMAVFNVPDVLARDHAANYAGMMAAAARMDDKAVRARTNGDFYTREANKLREAARRYAKVFGYEVPA